MSLSQVLLLGWVVAVVAGSVFAAVVKEDRRPPRPEKPDPVMPDLREVYRSDVRW